MSPPTAVAVEAGARPTGVVHILVGIGVNGRGRILPPVLNLNTTVMATNVPTVLSKLQKWGDYASYGEPVKPSKFIPMKTPLSPTLLQHDTFESVLTLPHFLAEQRAKGREVGLIIDLSNHDCLYLDGVPPYLERVHVRNVAKSIPNPTCTSEVIAVANEFWLRKPDHTRHTLRVWFQSHGVCFVLLSHRIVRTFS